MNKRVKEFLDRSSNYEVIEYIGQLQEKNKQLQERMEYLERSNNRREVTIFEQSQKIIDLEDNWVKLKEYLGTEWYCFDNESVEFEIAKDILDKMKELEGSVSNE